MNANPRSYFGMVGRIAAGWRAWRDEVRTESLINRLPPHIRKDIGWPDTHPSRQARRAGTPFGL
ncbi:hypothetical protein [Aquibium oceanicum]|uniref:DUF1127 domain-containing protein n=1 Tax=Aquibium oceanicum TaxID=1670800 RepID=A0A1L3SLH3_9HYPH|nr:hypothetical protein [Aquibium oceanicum]APH70220.1 hypothetical protein BSQ44_01605 [Aquibium oceanicum]